MHFKIDISKLPHTESKYFLCINTFGPKTVESVCVMGQILQQMEYRLIDKQKQPYRNLNDMNVPAGIFTRYVRGRNVQTDIASKIMQTDPFPPENQKKIAALLLPHHTIEFINADGTISYSSVPT